MACSKKELFDKELQKEADIFKVLSHPARLHILRFLSGREECFSGNITEELPLGRTTINQHLKELKNAGLIKGEINGNKVSYCINNCVIKEMRSTIEHFLEGIKSCTNSNCGTE